MEICHISDALKMKTTLNAKISPAAKVFFFLQHHSTEIGKVSFDIHICDDNENVSIESVLFGEL